MGSCKGRVTVQGSTCVLSTQYTRATSRPLLVGGILVMLDDVGKLALSGFHQLNLGFIVTIASVPRLRRQCFTVLTGIT